MIRAEELMIDDWVLDGTQDAQVTGITCDGIIETTANANSNIELLEPIPITPEILEKSGFERCDDEDWLAWYGGLERVIWKDGGYTLITSVKADRCYEGYCLNIHELQHALRLCGITKEIEL